MLCISIGCGVEDRAVDTLGTILLVNKSLVCVDNHNKVVVVRDGQACDRLELLSIQVHAVLASEAINSVINPLLVPSLVGDLFLQLLSCEERAPENVGATLRVGDVGWEQNLAIGGAGVDDRAINGYPRNGYLGLTFDSEVFECLSGSLPRKRRVSLRNQS